MGCPAVMTATGRKCSGKYGSSRNGNAGRQNAKQHSGRDLSGCIEELSAADCKTYVRMKSNTELGLQSDRFQWLLDVLAVLQGCGTFQATRAEMEEITAKMDFELKTAGEGQEVLY